jgi:hypothetical protein
MCNPQAKFSCIVTCLRKGEIFKQAMQVPEDLTLGG